MDKSTFHTSTFAAPLAVATVALGIFGASAGAAEARDGCGPGFHRGFYGYCRPNLGYRPFVYRRFLYRPVFYGDRRFAHGPRWHRWGGYRHVGWGGWHRGWGGHHGGWHHRW